MYELELEHMAAQLGAGQHTGLKCPACGDNSPDRALSMLVDPPSIKAICHRASCGFVYRNSNHRWESMGAVVRPSRARPYTGELHTLDEADYLWFLERFHLPKMVLGEVRKSDDRYFLPIFSPEGSRRGWVSRKPWAGSPLQDCDEQFNAPKSLTYMDNEEPVQHWTDRFRYNPVVLVEDQISAMRVMRDLNMAAVAILGTGLNEEKVAELQRNCKSIILALDADATGQAFSMARKWGQAFDSCRVIILKKDLKDEPIQVVKQIFRQFAPS